MDTLFTPSTVEPVLRRLSNAPGNDRCVWRITVAGEEYEATAAIAAGMWSTQKAAQLGDTMYNRGALNSPEDPTRAERVGRLAEVGFAKLFGLAVDSSYRQGGDDTDFRLPDGSKLDVKARLGSAIAQPDEGWTGLVKARNAYGDLAWLKSDAYIFTYVVEDRVNGNAVVEFIGWADRRLVESQPIVASRRAGLGIANYEIAAKTMRAMRDLPLAVAQGVGQGEAPAVVVRRPSPFGMLRQPKAPVVPVAAVVPMAPVKMLPFGIMRHLPRAA